MNLLSPGQKIKPIITVDKVIQLFESLYDIKIEHCTELNSYDDRNFKIVTTSQQEYLSKVTNTIDSANDGLLEAIQEVCAHLTKQGLIVPLAIKNKHGEFIHHYLRANSEDKYAVRLFKYIPGEIIKNVPYTIDLMTKLGQLLGNFRNSLKKFNNEIIQKRKTIWNLASVPHLRSFLPYLPDDKRAMIKNVIETFEMIVINNISSFENGIIHGDINEQNILVKEIGENQFEPNAIIDLNDVHFAPIVFDLACACMYMMLDCNTMSPVDLPKYIIKGYLSVTTLNELDLHILPICVIARLSQSLTLGAYSIKNDPGNDYLLTTSKNGWKLFELLNSFSNKQLLEKWQ